MTRGRIAPPRLAAWLLGSVLPGSVSGRSVLGDLHEEYLRRVPEGVGPAQRWYWREAMSVVFTTLREGEMPQSWTPPREVSDAFRFKGRGDGMMQQALRDIRYAVRALSRTPGFAAVAALTLALGIGANTAIFSVVNGVLLRPMPFGDPDQLVAVRSTAPGLGYDDFSMSPGIYVQYAEAQVFDELALFNRTAVNVTGDGNPERIDASFSSRSLFPTLGVSPVLGRNFTEEEDLPEGPQVVVISYAVWQTRYSGSRDVLGRALQVNGVTREIVGVMPEGFGFPFEDTQLWMPLAIDPSTASPGQFGFQSIGRLKQGAELDQVRGQLAQVVQRLRDDSAAQATQGGSSFVQFLDEGKYAPRLLFYKEQVVGDLQRPLWILLGTVGFVLLIACANVANLFLVRAEARQREIAVRSALGAGRSALVRHFLAEGAVLAVLGGLAGLALAWVGVPALLSVAPDNLPRMDGVGMDAGVLAFTASITGLAVLLFGLLPVFRYTSPRLLATLKQGGRGTAGVDRHAMRNLLVIAQTAMALVLLVGSGLLVRSFWEIRSIDPGFDAEDVLTFRLSLPGGKYDTPFAQAGFHGRLMERIAALPGVESVGLAGSIPLGGQASGTAFDVEEFPTEVGTLPPIMWNTFTTAGFFETMKIPLVAGRTFEPRDHEEGSDAVVVSQAMVERFWGDGNADVIGKRLRFSGDTLSGWLTIEGVVGSVRDRGLREDPSEMIYLPVVGPRGDDGWGVSSLAYAVRGRNVVSLGPLVRAQVWELDADLPLTTMITMEDLVSNSLVRLSFTMLTLAISAGIALVLGAVGLYGVLSYVVSQRTQEIGVRMALGAPVASVRKMVVMQGARLAALGLGLGLLASAGLTRVLQGLLYGTEALDPLTFGGTSVLLMAVVFLASYVPARRASNVDPVQSMRND